MDEYKEKLIKQIRIHKNDGWSVSDVARKLKIGTEYSKQLFALIESEDNKKAFSIDDLEDHVPVAPESKKEIVLDDEQKDIILHAWNEDKIDSLKEITQRVFGSDYDGRTNEAKAIKAFLATRECKTRATNNPVSKTEKIILTDDQKEFIRNHSLQLSPLEITQSLFSNPQITPLSAEARSVRNFMQNELPPTSLKVKVSSDFREVTKEYKPPRNVPDAIRRINAYVFEKLDPEKLNPRQKHNTNALMHYLNVHRFQMIMNEFADERDQELMESSMIRWLYDKGDLSEEEVDLYINWGLDMVHHIQMNRELQQLKVVRDQSLDDKGTPPKALVDQMNKLLEALDSNQKRQKAAQNDLSGKRRDRVESSGKNNQSVVQLIEGFKDHAKRKLIEQFAESRKKVVGNEIDRLTTMDDLKFELFGCTKEELLQGL